MVSITAALARPFGELGLRLRRDSFITTNPINPQRTTANNTAKPTSVRMGRHRRERVRFLIGGHGNCHQGSRRGTAFALADKDGRRLDPTPRRSRPASPLAWPGQRTDPGPRQILMLRNTDDLLALTIGATDGEIGKIRDLYFDDDRWVVRYLVVETGSWLDGHKVLISPISTREPDWQAKVLPVTLNIAQVRGCPGIDTDKPVSRQHQIEYLDYYQYPHYWVGQGIWGGGIFPQALAPGYAGADASSMQVASEAYAKAERHRHRNEDPHLRSCKVVIGYHIRATDGDIGHVSGMLYDAETWAIRYLIVDTSNWWLGHKVLIAPQWIRGMQWADQTVSVDLTRAAVKAAPAFDSVMEVNRQMETDLYRHHAREGYWAEPIPAHGRAQPTVAPIARSADAAN